MSRRSRRRFVPAPDQLVLRSTGSGEWPRGIHWSPGEERPIPIGYPLPKDADGNDEAPPAWLKPVEPPAPEPAPAPDVETVSSPAPAAEPVEGG